MAPQTQVRNIKVYVDVNGDKSLKKISDGLDKIGKSAKRTSDDVNYLKKAFNAISGFAIGGIGVKGLVDTADSMQLLQGRIASLTGDAEGAADVMAKLGAVSNDVAIPIEAAAETYARLSQALGDIGVEGDAIIGMTRTLSQSFRIAGSTSAEMTGALVQLSQGLASGQLRGQELRSVLEANVIIGGILAKSLGTTRGQLLKFAEKRGGITAPEVLKALAESTDVLNGNMKGLGLTIGQRLTIALNTIKVQMNDLNNQFGISEKVIGAIDFVLSDMSVTASVLAGVLVASLVPALNATLASITSVGIAAGIASGGTFLVLAGAISGITYALVNFEKTTAATGSVIFGVLSYVQDKLSTFFGFLEEKLSFLSAKGGVLGSFTSVFQRAFGTVSNDLDKASKSSDSFATELAQDFVAIRDGAGKTAVDMDVFSKALSKASTDLERMAALKTITNLKELNRVFALGNITIAEYDKTLKEIKKSEIESLFSEGRITRLEKENKLYELLHGKKKKGIKISEDELATQSANLAYLNKRIDLEQYAQKIRDIGNSKLTKGLAKGSSSIFDITAAKRSEDIIRLNKELGATTISFYQFEDSINTLKIAELNEKFAQGKVSLSEYRTEMLALQKDTIDWRMAAISGTSEYLKTVKTDSQIIADGITSAFKATEDALLSFIKTGNANFAQFTQAVLDDINRMIIRAKIIAPLARGLLNYSSGTTTIPEGGDVGVLQVTQAKGGAWNNGVKFFADGGVFNGPTPFSYSGGLGVLGEAGPEAVMPLKRDNEGKLGVVASPANVIVNVVNSTTDTEVRQSETTNANGEKVIELLIVGKVKEAFAKGSFDKQFQSQYGIRRKGQ